MSLSLGIEHAPTTRKHHLRAEAIIKHGDYLGACRPEHGRQIIRRQNRLRMNNNFSISAISFTLGRRMSGSSTTSRPPGFSTRSSSVRRDRLSLHSGWLNEVMKGIHHKDAVGNIVGKRKAKDAAHRRGQTLALRLTCDPWGGITDNDLRAVPDQRLRDPARPAADVQHEIAGLSGQNAGQRFIGPRSDQPVIAMGDRIEMIESPSHDSPAGRAIVSSRLPGIWRKFAPWLIAASAAGMSATTAPEMASTP